MLFPASPSLASAYENQFAVQEGLAEYDLLHGNNPLLGTPRSTVNRRAAWTPTASATDVNQILSQPTSQPTANAGDVAQQMALDLSFDVASDAAYNKASRYFNKQPGGMPSPATQAATKVNKVTKATEKAIKAGPKFKAAGPLAPTKHLRTAGKLGKFAVPAFTAAVLAADAYGQSKETEALGKDKGGQVAGNVVGAGLGGKLGLAAGGLISAGLTAVTGGAAAPLAPIITGVTGAYGASMGSKKGGEIGREVNLIPGDDKDPHSASTYTIPGQGQDGGFTSRGSALYKEQLRRQREQVSDAMIVQGLQENRRNQAKQADMMLANYLQQSQQYNNLMSNILR